MNFAEPHRITTETKRTTVVLKYRYVKQSVLVKSAHSWFIFGEDMNQSVVSAVQCYYDSLCSMFFFNWQENKNYVIYFSYSTMTEYC